MLFLRRQRLVRDPLLPLHLLTHRTRAAGLLAVGFGGLGITGVFLLLTLYFQQALGYSALTCGMAYLPYTAGMIAGSSLSGRLLPRTGPCPLLTTGLLVAAAGLALLVRAGDPRRLLGRYRSRTADRLPGRGRHVRRRICNGAEQLG